MIYLICVSAVWKVALLGFFGVRKERRLCVWCVVCLPPLSESPKCFFLSVVYVVC